MKGPGQAMKLGVVFDGHDGFLSNSLSCAVAQPMTHENDAYL
jgi:hypothetical protein